MSDKSHTAYINVEAVHRGIRPGYYVDFDKLKDRDDFLEEVGLKYPKLFISEIPYSSSYMITKRKITKVDFKNLETLDPCFKHHITMAKLLGYPCNLHKSFFEENRYGISLYCGSSQLFAYYAAESEKDIGVTTMLKYLTAFSDAFPDKKFSIDVYCESLRDYYGFDSLEELEKERSYYPKTGRYMKYFE